MKFLIIIPTLALLICNAQNVVGCQDSTASWIVNGKKRSCWHARNAKNKQCTKKKMQVNCPRACGLCDDVQCKIKGELRYPQLSDFEGAQATMLQVEKVGEEKACNAFGNAQEEWGCKHDGSAYIESRPSSKIFEKGTEEATIVTGAGGSYRFTITRNFQKMETDFKDPDGGNGRANFIVKVNDKVMGIFRHKPNRKKVPSSLDKDGVWIINEKYNGNFFVNVACDNQCNCKVSKEEATCEVKAAVAYPRDLPTDPDDFGDNEDFIVKQFRKDELCNATSGHSWCSRYTDVILGEDSRGDDLATFRHKRQEFVSIPDAAGKDFSFYFKHAMPSFDQAEDGGKLVIYAGKETFGPFDSHTYVVDGRCADYKQQVFCDDDCVCATITLVADNFFDCP